MNKARRKLLADLANQLSDLKESLDFLRDDEQTAFDNLPESLQGSEMGQAMENAISVMEEQSDQIDSIIAELIEL